MGQNGRQRPVPDVSWHLCSTDLSDAKAVGGMVDLSRDDTDNTSHVQKTISQCGSILQNYGKQIQIDKYNGMTTYEKMVYSMSGFNMGKTKFKFKGVFKDKVLKAWAKHYDLITAELSCL